MFEIDANVVYFNFKNIIKLYFYFQLIKQYNQQLLEMKVSLSKKNGSLKELDFCFNTVF